MDEPPWLCETQVATWANGWEPTALGSDVLSAWLLSLTGGEREPPPFEAAIARITAEGALARAPGAEAQDAGGLDHATEGAKVDLEPEEDYLWRKLYGQLEKDQQRAYGPWVDETTDTEGWIYATRPSRLHVHRDGGRAGPRLGDRYRQRWWCHGEAAGVVPPRKASKADEGRHEEDRKRAMDSLWHGVGGVFGRRSFSEMPLDPTAAVRRSHKDSEAYQAMCKRLPPWKDLDLLGQFCVATLYMRAAYGYVGRIGKFDSILAAVPVFSVGKSIFDLADQVDCASNTEAFLDMVGLSRDDLVCAQWRLDGAFQAAYTVARDDAMKWIVVSVRGTISTKDILTDMAVRCADFLEGQAHEGMVQASQQLLDALRGPLEAELAARPGYRLVFCGHSMGGAVAAMCAALLRHEKHPWASNCVAFGVGTPAVLSRSVGERLLREKVVFTAVNERDWSPRSSMSSVDQLLDELCELSMVRSAMRAATGNEMALARAESPRSELLPPGLLLQIAPPRPGSDAPALLEAAPTDYRHSMPVWPDVEAHIPLNYLRGLLLGYAEALRSSVRGPGFDGPPGDKPPKLVASNASLAEAASFLPTAFPDPALPGGLAGVAALCGASVLGALQRAAAPREGHEQLAATREGSLPGSASSKRKPLSRVPSEVDRGRELVRECLEGTLPL